MVIDKSSNKLFTQGLKPLQSLLPENAKKILKKDGFVYFEIIKKWKNIVSEKLFKDTAHLKNKKYNLEIIPVVSPNKSKSIAINNQAYTDDGYIINSNFLNDLTIEDAKKNIIHRIEEKKIKATRKQPIS